MGVGLCLSATGAGSEAIWAVRCADGRAIGKPLLVYEVPSAITPLGICLDGAYYFQKQEVDRDIYTAELDFQTGALTQEVKRLPTRFEGVNFTGRYSPDGKQLAWISKPISKPKKDAFRSEILDTGQTREFAIHHPLLTARLWPSFRWFPDSKSVIVPWSSHNARGWAPSAFGSMSLWERSRS